ncbi:MAG: HMG-box domain-containing protein [Halobacteriaceae archaeon]
MSDAVVKLLISKDFTPEIDHKHDDNISVITESKEGRNKSDNNNEKGQSEKYSYAPPKRNFSAYMLFCRDKRDAIKAENPGMKVTEITSELGKRWKMLYADDRKAYEECAAQDKTRYAQEMEDYKKQTTEKTKVNRTTKAKSSQKVMQVSSSGVPEGKCPVVKKPDGKVCGCAGKFSLKQGDRTVQACGKHNKPDHKIVF